MGGSRNPAWEGGKNQDIRGYIMIWVEPGHPFFSMAPRTRRYIPEHRLVMAEHLGRCLTTDELVHHLNGTKDDNRIENLALVELRTHNTMSLIQALQCRVKELEDEVYRLSSRD